MTTHAQECCLILGDWARLDEAAYGGHASSALAGLSCTDVRRALRSAWSLQPLCNSHLESEPQGTPNYCLEHLSQTETILVLKVYAPGQSKLRHSLGRS